MLVENQWQQKMRICSWRLEREQFLVGRKDLEGDEVYEEAVAGEGTSCRL